MLYSGTDPESYITEYTLVYEEKKAGNARDVVSPPSLQPPLSLVKELRMNFRPKIRSKRWSEIDNAVLLLFLYYAYTYS